MRKYAIALAALAFAACSSEPAPEAEDAPAVEETTDASDLPGTYEVTAADGTKFTAVLNADGTYVDTAADGSEMEHGTWAQVDGKDCFTPAEDSEGVQTCYTASEPAADGTFTATPDEGDPITVKKVS